MTQELGAVDRLEIQELLARYCHAIDSRNWDKLRLLFVEGAALDFQALDGPDAGIDEVVCHLQDKLSRLCHTQHSVSTTSILLDGDHAKATSVGHLAIVWLDRFGNKQTAFVGLWYIDQFERQAAGWKFSKHVVECSWAENIPHDRWVRNFAFTPKREANISLLQSMGL